MRRTFQTICLAGALLIFAALAWGQSGGSPSSAPPQATDTPSANTSRPASKEHVTGAGKEIGKGGEDIGKGVAQGTADLARGTAGGIGSLARGRVGSAAGDLGKGVGGMSKTVAVGTAKGVGKIGKGIGGEFRKL